MYAKGQIVNLVAMRDQNGMTLLTFAAYKNDADSFKIVF